MPTLALLAVLPFSWLLTVGLLINLAATVAVILLVIKLYGEGWPARAWLYVTAFFLAWAPYRVTLRMGQNTLIVMALLLAALLARQRKHPLLAGLLLGLSLSKYSLTLPFFLYVLWRREWKVAASAVVLMIVLTEVFAWHLGISFFDAIASSFHVVSHVQTAGPGGFTGTTEIKMLIFSLTGENAGLTSMITIALALGALALMAIVFQREPQSEKSHFAILALFALWSAYHRTYDSALCLVPAALLVDWLTRGRSVRFSRFWLAGLALFIVSVPGLLTQRLRLGEDALKSNLAGLLGLHIERILVFGLFASLLWVMWKSPPAHLINAGERQLDS